MHKHYKNLTPMVTSAAEALVSDFYQSIQARMADGARLGITQYARLLMRHPELSQYFAVCLQSYMTSLDQARAGRNPSYKSMTIATVARFQSFKRFTSELARMNGALQAFYELIRDMREFHFHEWVVDWYGIAGQLPEVHRYFERPQDNMVAKRLRNAQGDPPWLYGRS